MDLVHSRQGLTAGPGELARRAAEDDRSWLDSEGVRWRFLGQADTGQVARRRQAVPSWVPTAETVAEQMADLESRQGLAMRRMERPRYAAASSESASKLVALASRHEPTAAGPRPAMNRDLAMLVGTAIHRLFEEWDLGADAADQLARGRSQVEARLTAWLPGPEQARAIEVAPEILDRFKGGALWQRWLAIADRIVARERPMLGSAPEDGPALDFLVGAIDLIYRDPDDDRLVIADFKTDRVESEGALTERATVYQAQEQVYAQAVQAALGLEEAPRAELWFLWPDRVWRSS